MLTLNDGRNELWQWDTGRKLTVDADCTQVHFSNKFFGRSVDVDVVDGTVAIPDVLLQVDNELIAWAFVGTPENGYTKISKVFKVNKRNKPANYVFTPTEQTTLGQIMERLDDLEAMQDPDAIKNAVEDYLEHNPVEAPVQSVNGKTGKVKLTAEDVGAISQDDLQEATNKALAQAKASGEFDGADGQPGKDGISATHSWNGTILTVTSESGTSSADLKGENGDKGDPGPQGEDGGYYTPGVSQPDADNIQFSFDASEPGMPTVPAVTIPLPKPDPLALDTSLTQEGKAADAKAVGDAISKFSGGKVDFVVQDTAPNDTSVLWVDPSDNTEEDFSGISVTGASVGQTVKIAAVDENGVPTAWEAVEFPAEEEYELIQEVVSDGTISAVKVEQWADGTPLNAKKIRILTSAPKNDTTVNVVYYAYFDNSSTAALISTLLTNTSRFIFGKYEYIKKRDYWRVYKAEAQTSNPNTHGSHFGTIMETSPSMMNEYTTAEKNIITKVTAGGVSGAQFPDGTILKFYGVRA